MQPPTNDVTSPSLAVWKRALLFHPHNWNNLLLISPLLLLPVVTDVLHTVLIRQTLERKGLLVGSAVLQAFRALPALIALKFYFWCQGLLWSFVPLYGWIKDIDIRICWAMASNVLVFERASTTNCRRRCWELAQHPQKGMAIRTLITVWIMGSVIMGSGLDILTLVLISQPFLRVKGGGEDGTQYRDPHLRRAHFRACPGWSYPVPGLQEEASEVERPSLLLSGNRIRAVTSSESTVPRANSPLPALTVAVLKPHSLPHHLARFG